MEIDIPEQVPSKFFKNQPITEKFPQTIDNIPSSPRNRAPLLSKSPKGGGGLIIFEGSMLKEAQKREEERKEEVKRLEDQIEETSINYQTYEFDTNTSLEITSTQGDVYKSSKALIPCT